MQTLIKKIEVKSRKDAFCLVPFGDWHLGNAGCDEKGIEDDIEGADFLLGMGDLVDAIPPGDKRFDIKAIADKTVKTKEDLENLVINQCDQAIDILKPHKSKLLGLIEGNHEFEFAKKSGAFNPTSYIAKALGVPNLSDMVSIILHFQRQASVSQIKILAAHGNGGGRKKGSKVNIGDDLCYCHPDYHLYFIGHIHYQNVSAVATLSVNNEGVEVGRDKVVGLTGTRLKTYGRDVSTYGQRKLYAPTSLGCPRYYIYPDKGIVESRIRFKIK